jgi:hypothetical protein
VSELAATLREAIAALAASDRALQRFGAATHHYALAPPRDDVDPSWPPDLRELVTTFASGGAGPYHGFTLGEPYALGELRALPVGHMGCGYAAVVALDTGAVWIDARAIGVVAPIHASFTAYYLDWIDRLARNVLPDAFVPPGACALAAALGGYLGVHEQRLGLAPGSISGAALADALAQLGPGAITITAQQSPLFPDGTAVAPCIACAQLVANLGLSLAVVRPAT